jgi:malonyl CoA-acyl carrier protein transacylase
MNTTAVVFPGQGSQPAATERDFRANGREHIAG